MNKINAIKPEKPRIPATLPEMDVISLLGDGERITTGMVADSEMAYETIDKLSLENMIFKNTSFIDVSFTNVELTDVIFEKCDLSNVDFSDGIFHRVEFRQTKLMGANLSGSFMRNVLFDGCMADMSMLGFCNHKYVGFHETALKQADFNECTLKKTAFENCRMDQANFSGTSLEGIDLSRSLFDQLTISPDKIPGCIVTPEQAISFSRALGLILADS